MQTDNIGLILKNRIKECGFTLEKFAEITDVNPATLKKHIRGNVKYNYEYLKIYSHHLNCSCDYLIGESTYPNPEYKNIFDITNFSEETINELKKICSPDNPMSKYSRIALEQIICNDGLLIAIIMYLGITKPLNQTLEQVMNSAISQVQKNNISDYVKLNCEVMYSMLVMTELNKIKAKISSELLDEYRDDLETIKAKLQEQIADNPVKN